MPFEPGALATTLSSFGSSSFLEEPSCFSGQGTPASFAKLAAICGERPEKLGALELLGDGGVGRSKRDVPEHVEDLVGLMQWIEKMV